MRNRMVILRASRWFCRRLAPAVCLWWWMAPCGSWAQDAPAAAGAEVDEAASEELPPLVVEPALLEFVEAPYPEAAQERGVEGLVGLVIEIGVDGTITAAEVVRSLDPDLDAAALEAVKGFRFTPAEDATGPVPVVVEFDYGFVLDATTNEQAIAQPDSAVNEVDPQTPVNLAGVLTEMGTKRLLSEFPVQVMSTDGEVIAETTTDAEGYFSFRGVPLGEVSVQSVHPEYRLGSRSVEVVEGQLTEMILWLKPMMVGENEIVAVYQREREEEVTRRTISLNEVRRVPGTFGDPIRVISSLPGTARPPFGSGFLVIRGANPEDTAFYVDGVRLPIIYHLGGYVSVLNGDMIEAVDYLPGGYSTRYGRSLGGVIDVRTKSALPEQGRLIWSTDLLDSGGMYEGTIGKKKRVGVTVAARRSYIDAFIPLFTRDGGFGVKPVWGDYQAKVTVHELPHGATFSVLAMGFDDKLLIHTPDDVAQGTDTTTQGDFAVRYNAHRVIARWERPLTDDWDLRVSPSVGRDMFEFTLGNDWRLYQTLPMAIVRADAPWSPSDALTVTPGVDAFIGTYDVSLEFPFSPEQFSETDPLAENEPYTTGFNGSFWSPDAFLDVRWRPLANRDALLLNPGLRYSTVILSDGFTTSAWDPRIAFRWSPFEKGALKGGTGMYGQPPQGPDLGFNEGESIVEYEHTWSSELGWEQQFTQAISADVTFFHKEMTDLIVESLEFEDVELDAPYVNAGIGRVDGMEFMIRHAPVGRFFGWISYTPSKSIRNNHPEVYGYEIDNSDGAEDGWYDFEFDQTHILVAVAAFKLPRSWELSTKVQYVTGNPYTPYDGGVFDLDQVSYFAYQTAEYNSERMPPFFAVDFRIDKTYSFKRWRLKTYLDVLNAFRGENPEFIQYNYDYTENTWVRGLPLIPSPGFEAEIFF